jgi:hypothetical protein
VLIFFTVSLTILCCALSTALYISVKRNFELLDTIEEYTDQISESLEEIDYYYSKIDKKSKLEIFLDEPVTRELVEDIKGTKKSIKKLAEKISILIEEE